MSQEVIDAVREIERDKGIEEGALVAALEDALLAAYKKTPGASRHATVEMHDDGEFRVYSVELPPDVEAACSSTMPASASSTSSSGSRRRQASASTRSSPTTTSTSTGPRCPRTMSSART